LSLRLRPTAAQDLAFVTSLERDSQNREFIGQWTDAEHLDAIGRKAGREHWIIEVDGKPAGYLIAYDARATDAGVYVKRLLVADKEKGIGTAALAAFLDDACAREDAGFVWLMVFDWNARAQAVYERLGFHRYEAPAVEEPRLAQVDSIRPGVWRMRIEVSGWRLRAR